ncbi:MAG: kat [Verrucomicrobia bacterium]|nr:kat [Verrucomicrobiota bacterium]
MQRSSTSRRNPKQSNVNNAKNTGAKLWRRASAVIAGGTGLISKRAEMFEARDWPAYFSRCSGCEVWDLDGKRYLDFVGGVGAVVLGYADPDVTEAVRRELAAGTYCTLLSPKEVELAELLLKLHPWAGKVRYARGGGEAMAMSVRIARAATGRSGVAFCGYHGWHDWYLAANLGETDALNGHLLPGLEPRGVPRELRGTSVTFRYNDVKSFDEAIRQLGDNLAAVVMEPMRSQFPKDRFIDVVAKRCRAAGAVFVVDEVTSGLRFGFPGALSRFGVEPDLVVYAKAMSNGFPFGVVIGRDDVMDRAGNSFISSSSWTDAIGPAAALAVLKKTQRLRANEVVWSKGEKIQAGLRTVAERFPACRFTVGGMPPALTTSFDLGAYSSLAQSLYVRKMRENGFIVSSYFYIMVAHEDEHINQLLEMVARVLGEIAEAIKAGRLAKESGAAQTQRGFARLT